MKVTDKSVYANKPIFSFTDLINFRRFWAKANTFNLVWYERDSKRIGWLSPGQPLLFVRDKLALFRVVWPC